MLVYQTQTAVLPRMVYDRLRFWCECWLLDPRTTCKHFVRNNKYRLLRTLPAIFSYFYLIVERADRIARELNASAKQKSWLGGGWGPREIEGLQTSLRARTQRGCEQITVSTAPYQRRHRGLRVGVSNEQWKHLLMVSAALLYNNDSKSPTISLKCPDNNETFCS